MCSTVLVEIIYVLTAWVAPIESVCTASAQSPSSARKGAAAETAWMQCRQVRLCWIRWTSVGGVHFFIWREGPKCLSQPTQEGEGCTVVLTPFFLSLPADEFHWGQFSLRSKLKLKKTQQQGKVPSPHSTGPLQREVFSTILFLYFLIRNNDVFFRSRWPPLLWNIRLLLTV